MSKKKETKEEEIIRLYKANESTGAIRRISGARLDRVEYTIDYYQKKNSIPPPRPRGPHPKSTPEVLNAISTMTTV
ncbi:hypothetical protein M9Y10_040057 [Tritrichomonas musculus]|uniref:HTH psq-type domain-containing protein n=1 Tax=Tritrichomonas musculus TaxID=1915356 RepID=A0ABR2GQ84_9EUKA